MGDPTSVLKLYRLQCRNAYTATTISWSDIYKDNMISKIIELIRVNKAIYGN